MYLLIVCILADLVDIKLAGLHSRVIGRLADPPQKKRGADNRHQKHYEQAGPLPEDIGGSRALPTPATAGSHAGNLVTAGSGRAQIKAAGGAGGR
jgi:hypothetical protein